MIYLHLKDILKYHVNLIEHGRNSAICVIFVPLVNKSGTRATKNYVLSLFVGVASLDEVNLNELKQVKEK